MLVDWFWPSLVLSILLRWLLWHGPQRWPHRHTTTITAAHERCLKPRTPADCPTCRQAGATATDPPPACISVIPWRKRKSRRGAPKRILTHGVACPNRTCLSYQITDAHIHALVGDGAHGCRCRSHAAPSVGDAPVHWGSAVFARGYFHPDHVFDSLYVR
jgi:hypothetical protein